MSDDIAAFWDELVGRSEWVYAFCPTEGGPRFGKHWMFGTIRLTESALERFLALRAGTPPVEAQSVNSATYKRLPKEFLAFGWCLDRSQGHLRAVNRNNRMFGETYFNPRIVAADTQTQERVDTQVNTTKKPPYRSLSEAMYAAIAKYEKELSGIKSQKGRAAFLVRKVGCSVSLAIQILSAEKKR